MGASSGGSEAPSAIKGDTLNMSRAQHYRVATLAHYIRYNGSLPSPLHLAIIRNEFLMIFLPAATWTRAVGLRGLRLYLKTLFKPFKRD